MISLKTKQNKKNNKKKKQEIIPKEFFSRYARFYPLNLRFIKESKDQLI